MAKFFSDAGRAGAAKVLDPVASRLIRLGVSPNAVTLAGTAGVVAGCVLLTARGHLLWAFAVVTVSASLDVLDGAMARARGSSSRFGALLDSTMDRIADGAIFASVAYLMADSGDMPSAAAALLCLVGGLTVSYVKARAQSLGATCTVGFVERLERLLVVGLGVLLAGFGVPYALPATLWLLAVATAATAVQRVWHVRGQLNGDAVAQRQAD
ncbi:MAG: phosphatidylinositol phosphate synthase [Stackebrandtia sp.]